MLLISIVLIVGGAITMLLPLSAGYRARLGLRLVDGAQAWVAAEHVPALEARMSRRARGTGAGIVLAGLALLVADLMQAGVPAASVDVLLIMSLVFVCGAAGLALVEIWRPGVVHQGPRSARTIAPTLADYVPALLRALSWALPVLGLAVLLTTLALQQTPWFDAGAIMGSPVPLLAVAIPIVVGLARLATRRVLDSPQPARDDAELYWQDAVRADTLSFLLAPPAAIGLFALTVSGSVLDEAASTAAMAAEQVGPTWTLWLLITGYVVPVAVLIAALITIPWSNGMRHVRARLWDGQTPSPPGAAERSTGPARP